MDQSALITNLIEAIDGVAQAAANCGHAGIQDGVMNALEDAEETASLAKLVLPTLIAPSAPTPGQAKPGGAWAVEEDTVGFIVSGYATVADAEAALARLQQAGGDGAVFEDMTEAEALAHLGRQAAPASSPLPPHAPACSQCPATLDANGDCPDPNCASNAVPAQSFKNVMSDIHKSVEKYGRPGSVISNKPPGSLYT